MGGLGSSLFVSNNGKEFSLLFGANLMLAMRDVPTNYVDSSIGSQYTLLIDAMIVARKRRPNLAWLVGLQDQRVFM